MNVALIHEKQVIKSFWEQRIEKHSKVSGTEDTRMKNSALAKLREEWIWRLEKRNKHLKSFNEERLKRTKPEEQLEELQQRDKKKAREEEEMKENTETDGTQEGENMEDAEEVEQNEEVETNENSEEQDTTDVAEATEETEVTEKNEETETKDTEENEEVAENGEANLEEMPSQKPEMEIEPTEQE